MINVEHSISTSNSLHFASSVSQRSYCVTSIREKQSLSMLQPVCTCTVPLLETVTISAVQRKHIMHMLCCLPIEISLMHTDIHTSYDPYSIKPQVQLA